MSVQPKRSTTKSRLDEAKESRSAGVGMTEGEVPCQDASEESLNDSEVKSFDEIYNFLLSKVYPEGSSKNDKRKLRQKAALFSIQDSTLMHIGHKGRLFRVVSDLEERNQIVAHTHAGMWQSGTCADNCHKCYTLLI